MQSGINIFSPTLSNGALPPRPEFTPTGIERRFRRFSTLLFLAQALVCTLPAAGLFAMGRASLAGYYFFGMLGLVLLRLALVGRRDEILCLILAVGPFLNLLRQFAFFNVVIAVFALGLFYYFALSSGTVRDTVKRVPLFWQLALFVIVYYAISFMNSRQYSTNLRMLELVFAMIYVLIIGRSQALLGAALLGMILNACAVGVSMLPQLGSGGRLGMVETEGQMLGNPTQLGVPLAFGFLALCVDHGRWLNLQSKPLWRWLLVLPVISLLALTTSRASWLVSASGILIAVILGNRQRLKMWIVIAVGIGAFVAVLHSPYGVSLKLGLKRTFSDENSLRNRTSGRSDQWKVAWYAFNRSLDSMLVGYGPGKGGEVYAKYSGMVDGVKYGLGKKAALHSLFMQIGVEAGLAGLGLLLVWLAICFFKIFLRTLRSGLIFPIICLSGYVLIVVTVSGADINSGVFLGIALIGTSFVLTPSRQGGHQIPPTHVQQACDTNRWIP